VIIDTIMCDYGGVVADHYSEPYLSQLATELGTDRRGARDLVSERAPHGIAYRLDQIGKTEFWAAVRKLSPRKSFDDDVVQELWARTYIPNAAVLSLLHHVHSFHGVNIGIVMNEDRGRYEFILREFPTEMQPFIMVPSFEVGFVKPDPPMYDVVLERCGRTHRPDRVLYVDDRKTHVDPAIARGMQGHVHLNAGELANFIETLTLVAA